MNSTKSERKSRRSSILKAPKPRQPLQNVELNVSSTENSPTTSTTKIKRRVSFAEKKHVKEFCDSMEQGTVWDSTYEESELSQRNIQNSNNDENAVSIEFVNQSSKRRSQANMAPKTIDEPVVQESILTPPKSRRSSSAITKNTKVSEDSNSRVVECDLNISNSVFVEPTRIPFPANHFGSFKARRSLSISEGFTGQKKIGEKSSFRARSDSCPAIIDSGHVGVGCQSLSNLEPLTITGEDCNEVVPMNETIMENESVELTVPASMTSRSLNLSVTPNINFVDNYPISNQLLLPSTEWIGNSKSDEENLEVAKVSVEQAKFSIFHDNSMDMTEGVSNLSKIQQPAKFMSVESKEESSLVAEERTIFQMKTVGFTQAMSTVMSHSKSCLNELDLKETDLRSEKSIFHNKSMDFTEVVQTRSIERSEEPPTEKTTIFQNKSVDFTDIIQNIPSMKQPQLPPERTTIFHDKSVDFTEVVQNVPSMDQLQKLPPERTTIFHDKSVDFTEVVQNIPSVDQLQKLPPERTTIFHNKSLDFTEAVSGCESMRKSLFNHPEPGRATIFRNQSVDFVEVDARMEKPQLEKSREETETQGRKILQNHQSFEVAEAFSRISSLSKTRSKESSHSLKEKIENDAQPFIPATQEQVSEDSDLETHSPLRKRLKSVGNNSIDVTAALPYIMLRKLQIQRCNEIFDDKPMPEVTPGLSTFEPIAAFPPEETHRPYSEKTTTFQNQSMEMTEMAAPSFPYELASGPTVALSVREEITIFQNKLKEKTDALLGPSSFEPTLDGCTDSNDENDLQRLQNITILNDESMEITSAIPGFIRARENQVDENRPTTICQDQSMEMTVAVSRLPLAGNIAISSETYLPDYDEAKTTVFRDDSMDLTKEVQYSSEINKEIHTNENERGKCKLNDMTKFDNEGKTVFFRDDCMELTSAVQLISRIKTPFIDKENCPVGAEDRRLSKAQAFEVGSGIPGSKSKWLETTKSVPFLSSQKNKENRIGPGGLEEQSRVGNFGSEDITGVVPLLSQIEEEHSDERDNRISRKDSRTLVFGNEEMEITGVVPWSSDLNNVHPRMSSSDSSQSYRPAGGIETFPTAEKIHRRSSQVAKELFQKTISSPKYVGEKIEPGNVEERTGTADLDAEIRNLAERFALEDESGFDQATFLRQQARCMEDYEANSTASQDCNSAAQSARIDGVESRDSATSNEVTNSVDNEETADWKISSNLKAVNAFAENRDLSIVESHCLSSKSLEELRYRAYSVSKFQPQEIGYELTAAIRMAHSENFLETIMLEELQAVEPPSALEYSLMRDQTDFEIIGKKIDSEEYQEGGEPIVQTMEDVPNELLEMEIAEITMTQTVNMEKVSNDLKNENTEERMERKNINRSLTYVLKKPVSDATIFITSSSEIDDEAVKEYRSSNTGLTTAAEFSSESPNGPSEKLRRGENVLPIEDIEEEPAKFTNIARSWGSKNFANSTVIADDFTRQLMHRDIEETSIVLKNSLSDELPSVIDTNEEQNLSRSIQFEEAANDITMNAEISVHKSPFDILKENIKNLAGRLETIWTINRLDEKIMAFNFFSNSIVLAIYLNDNEDAGTHPVKVIGLLSQLVEDGTDPGVSLAHSLIMKKVDSATLTHSYRTYEDIPQMLDFVSTEVKLGMDFMFELERLRNRNVMEIHGNRIIFMVRTRDINAGIILNITMEIKPFGEINCNDITVSCILGSEKVREKDIKRLITNVKRDHRFLRFYMSDVKDYVDLMAETGFSATSGTGCN